MSSWTFLTSHAQVLLRITEDPHSTTREMAAQLGITERAVQRIVADLEDAGYISKRKEGRRNHYEVHLDQPMRHPAQRDLSVGELLAVLRNTEASEVPASVK